MWAGAPCGLAVMICGIRRCLLCFMRQQNIVRTQYEQIPGHGMDSTTSEKMAPGAICIGLIINTLG